MFLYSTSVKRPWCDGDDVDSPPLCRRGRGADSGVLVDACVVAAAGLAGLKLRHHQEVERPPSSGVTEPGVHPL